MTNFNIKRVQANPLHVSSSTRVVGATGPAHQSNHFKSGTANHDDVLFTSHESPTTPGDPLAPGVDQAINGGITVETPVFG